jgi:uncharacterized damage-inducible protein DinB
MKSLADRFRRWYEYERDCNVKSLEMLASVPDDHRSTLEFQKAVGRMAHLAAARQRWLKRLGHFAKLPDVFPQISNLVELKTMVAETESAWVKYLEQLDDNELSREFEYEVGGMRYRWNIEGVLTQVFGHAWYHRGQIAQLVAGLGGKAVDTDYIFWCKLTPVGKTNEKP